MNEIVKRQVDQAMQSMFPHGAGRVSHTQVRHHLEQVGQVAFREGRNDALTGLMTAQDVAEHFGVTARRARALIKNRHKRFGIGMRVGHEWLVHRSELPDLRPEAKYRKEQHG